MKYIVVILVVFIFSIKTYAHGTLIITGIEHEDGMIDVKIYSDKKSFLKEEMAVESIRKKPTKEKTIIPLSKVHEGNIALVIYHDENNDEKLNTGLFWRPKETSFRNAVRFLGIGLVTSNGYSPFRYNG